MHGSPSPSAGFLINHPQLRVRHERGPLTPIPSSAFLAPLNLGSAGSVVNGTLIAKRSYIDQVRALRTLNPKP